MPYVTSDQIRDISVKSVEMFLNDKVPLSVGLAKQASALQLNSEQIHRAVEATNSIAHLKVMSLSKDRTAEFDLCKYAEVVADIATPDIEKTASTETFDKVIEKKASIETPVEYSTQEKVVFFTKMAAVNARELEELKIQAEVLDLQITKQAALVSKEPRALEKVASVSSGDEFKSLSKIVFGKEEVYADTGIFKAAELIQAEKLQSMIKQASEMRAQIADKQKLHDQYELMKKAMLGSIIGKVGGAIGNGAASAATAVGKSIGGAAKAVVTAPFKALGGAAGRTYDNVSQSAGNAAKSAINPVRKAFGKDPLPMGTNPIKKYGLGAGIMGAAGIATDAAMYSPGTDATTGRSKDVWTSLQREPS